MYPVKQFQLALLKNTRNQALKRLLKISSQINIELLNYPDSHSHSHSHSSSNCYHIPAAKISEQHYHYQISGFNSESIKLIEPYFEELTSNINSELKTWIDTLTEVYTRNCLSKETIAQFLWENYCNLTDRKNAFLSVMILDIDHFKSFNDNYGHQLGDQTLKKFATNAASCLPENGLLIRYGGEEFLTLMISSPTIAVKSYQNLQKLKTEVTLSQSSSKVPITCSCGLSYQSVTSSDLSKSRLPSLIETLISQADQALYEAKAQGRNCGVVWLNQHFNGITLKKFPKQPSEFSADGSSTRKYRSIFSNSFNRLILPQQLEQFYQQLKCSQSRIENILNNGNNNVFLLLDRAGNFDYILTDSAGSLPSNCQAIGYQISNRSSKPLAEAFLALMYSIFINQGKLTRFTGRKIVHQLTVFCLENSLFELARVLSWYLLNFSSTLTEVHFYNSALANFSIGRYRTALFQIKTALKYDPGRNPFISLYLQLLFKTGSLTELMNYYQNLSSQQKSRLKPGDLNNLAISFLKAGNSIQALKIIKTALKKSTDNNPQFIYYETAARASCQANNYSLAEKYLLLARESGSISPELIEIEYYLLNRQQV